MKSNRINRDSSRPLDQCSLPSASNWCVWPIGSDGDGVAHWQCADRLSGAGHTPDDDHRHADDIRTLALRFDEPVDWTRFGIWLTMLLHRHGDALLRVKGILNVADAVNPTMYPNTQLYEYHHTESPLSTQHLPDG